MKIAILSDIHGNSIALDRTLEDIKEQGCRSIVCLGDIGFGGYDAKYCYCKMNDLYSGHGGFDVKIIRGETEEEFLVYKNSIITRLIGGIGPYKEFYCADSKLLDEGDISFIKGLPKKIVLSVARLNMYCCHGTPDSIKGSVTRLTPVSKLKNIVRKAGTDIVLCAHSHMPSVFYLEDGSVVVNVGSVGFSLTDRTKATYAIIDIQNNTGDFVVDFRNVEYDYQKAIKRLHLRKFQSAMRQAQFLEGK